jgi:hypothetical protein
MEEERSRSRRSKNARKCLTTYISFNQILLLSPLSLPIMAGFNPAGEYDDYDDEDEELAHAQGLPPPIPREVKILIASCHNSVTMRGQPLSKVTQVNLIFEGIPATTTIMGHIFLLLCGSRLGACIRLNREIHEAKWLCWVQDAFPFAEVSIDYEGFRYQHVYWSEAADGVFKPRIQLLEWWREDEEMFDRLFPLIIKR